MPTNVSNRGEIWLADLSPVIGHEQAGRRPVLIVSVDEFNVNRSELVVVVPLTTTIRNIPFHVMIEPPDGGLKQLSTALCDAVRSISRRRLVSRWGQVRPETMSLVEDRLRILMGL